MGLLSAVTPITKVMELLSAVGQSISSVVICIGAQILLTSAVTALPSAVLIIKINHWMKTYRNHALATRPGYEAEIRCSICITVIRLVVSSDTDHESNRINQRCGGAEHAAVVICISARFALAYPAVTALPSATISYVNGHWMNLQKPHHSHQARGDRNARCSISVIKACCQR